ncbi:unnamed protein product [Protopolystoma xenopodis]|uniref:Uncharacterized protein n=1 Tax=Protopolystoma xenopodis TaxID=117903 RepID=A0A3S5ASW1_9PLAT|nr:unnamed protein product [Protopolystoma xenopodis]
MLFYKCYCSTFAGTFKACSQRRHRLHGRGESAHFSASTARLDFGSSSLRQRVPEDRPSGRVGHGHIKNCLQTRRLRQFGSRLSPQNNSESGVWSLAPKHLERETETLTLKSETGNPDHVSWIVKYGTYNHVMQLELWLIADRHGLGLTTLSSGMHTTRTSAGTSVQTRPSRRPLGPTEPPSPLKKDSISGPFRWSSTPATPHGDRN